MSRSLANGRAIARDVAVTVGTRANTEILAIRSRAQRKPTLIERFNAWLAS